MAQLTSTQPEAERVQRARDVWFICYMDFLLISQDILFDSIVDMSFIVLVS